MWEGEKVAHKQTVPSRSHAYHKHPKVTVEENANESIGRSGEHCTAQPLTELEKEAERNEDRSRRGLGYEARTQQEREK